MEYMYKAGYDPQSFISFFEKIEAQEKKKPGAMAKAFLRIPMTPDRVAAAQKEMTDRAAGASGVHRQHFGVRRE